MYYRYYGASVSEIDPIQVIREAFQLIYSMNLHLPTRYLLLDRAIATLGSVGVELYPDFNVFEVARPYARGLLIDRFTPQRIAKRARRDALAYAHVFARGAVPVARPDGELRDGQIEVGFVHKGLDDFMEQMQRVFNRLVIALIVTGGLIGSSLIGDLRDRRAARARRQRRLGHRLRALDGARHVAPLGRRPLRAALISRRRAAGGSHVNMTIPSSRVRAVHAVRRERGRVVVVGQHEHAVAVAVARVRSEPPDERAADALPLVRLVDGELVEEHLGALVRVRELDAGDEADGELVLVRDEQVVAVVREEALDGVVDAAARRRGGRPRAPCRCRRGRAARSPSRGSRSALVVGAPAHGLVCASPCRP